MANRRQWLTSTGVGAVAAALVLSGLTNSALGTTTDDPAPQSTPTPTATGTPAAGTPANAPGAAMGAFTDSGADGVRSLSALETWLGGTQMRVGHTYLPGDRWGSIEGDTGLLQPWADWKRADPTRLFVLNVPMQENNEDDLSDEDVRSRIQAGASGAYDVHFTKLAQRLVRMGVPDTVIVLGWEMNGTTYTHRCGPDPTDWKTYWNRIVTAMRAVPGQHFRFDFAPNRGQDAIGWTECYPGDATVDIIGMDSYDQPPGNSFYDQVTEPYGLQAQVDFAAKHNKAISYPEWGLFRNGDNPDYMSLMLGWIAAHKPLYQTITDYCPHGVWQCTDNPKSSRVYRSVLFDRKPAAPTPSPTVTGSPVPSLTPSPSLTPTAGPSASPSVSPSVSPSAALPGTPSPTAVPLPSVLATLAPTATPNPAQGPGQSTSTSAPAPAVGAEACLPLQLTEEQKKQYESGEVCIRLRPKKAAKPAS